MVGMVREKMEKLKKESEEKILSNDGRGREAAKRNY